MPLLRLVLLLITALSGLAPLAAQESAPERPAPVIGRIELTRRNIFADSEATFILPKLVNRLHVTTRPYVIERELLFQRDRPLSSDAVEETVHRLGELAALAWVGRGETNLGVLGFSTNSIALTVELRNETKHAVSFGGPSPSGYPCAAVTFENEPWICEIPIGLHYLVRTHLGLAENSR